LENKKRYSIKNILLTILWCGIGAGMIVLLVAGIRKKDAQQCKAVEISISATNNNYFVDKNDIRQAIEIIAGGSPVGKTIGSLNLKMMELQLKKNIWVKNAELFLDNNEVLKINVSEKIPVARVFSSAGVTFYIDEDISILPLSDKCSPLLPVFTGYPAGDQQVTKADSSLLKDIRTISLAIQKDSFLMAMIDQVDITPQRSFEMMPKIGNQVIVFGDAADADEKFKKLQLFYRQVMVNSGWNNYSVINVQYKNQVVAKRRGAEDVTADSLRTLMLMQMIVNNAEKQANDSLQNGVQGNENITIDSSMVQQSIQRDEMTETSNTVETKAPAVQPVKPVAVQPDPIPRKKITADKPAVPKKTTVPQKKTAPKKNDYSP
jgi:cell division protein FtsQ